MGVEVGGLDCGLLGLRVVTGVFRVVVGWKRGWRFGGRTRLSLGVAWGFGGT